MRCRRHIYDLRHLLILVLITVGIIYWNLPSPHTTKLSTPIMSTGDQHKLEAREGWFWIDGKKTRLFSGAMHYFRIPREYWRDRLIKLRDSGCNVLETYVPWNLHEPRRGTYNFNEMLDLRSYVKLAEECGLFVIIRPGPFICSEWDLGGLPSWLLRDREMRLRSNYEPYMEAVTSYFKHLFTHFTDLQYSQGGGPIIAYQIENEFGSFSTDTSHLEKLKQMMVDNGASELMFTSDNEQGLHNGAVPGVLMMANFQDIGLGKDMLKLLEGQQPDMPRMCMEFWTGWFDHWGDKQHQVWPLVEYTEALTYILEEYGSVNFYMFHGGTNFGFMAGANEQTENDQLKDGQDYKADVTSYDYDAPVSEEGRMTLKYKKTKELLSKYTHEVIYLGDCPENKEQLPFIVTYDDVAMTEHLTLSAILNTAYHAEIQGRAVPMEMLPWYDNHGQSYGWILYRTRITQSGDMRIEGQVRDRTQVYNNGRLVKTFDCNTNDMTVEGLEVTDGVGQIDLLIENMGRTNYQPINKNVMNVQRKGLDNKITLGGAELEDWTAYCLDFDTELLTKLRDLQFVSGDVKEDTPVLYKGSLDVKNPSDTFLDMSGWGKGIVILNGRNLGRYWPEVGPTRTMYVPGPWLVQGANEFLVFELEKVETPVLRFTDKPVL